MEIIQDKKDLIHTISQNLAVIKANRNKSELVFVCNTQLGKDKLNPTIFIDREPIILLTDLIKHGETKMKQNSDIKAILNANGINTDAMDRASMNKLASNLFMAASPKVRQDTVKKQKESDKKLAKTQDRKKKAIFTDLKPILSKSADELLDLHLNSNKGHKAKSSFVLGTISKYSREIVLTVTIQKKSSKAKQTVK